MTDTLAPPMEYKTMLHGMTELQETLAKIPGAKLGDDCGPLRHFFGQGLYIREITGTKGTIHISKLHKTTHPLFVMTGDVSVCTTDPNDEPVRIKAPHFGMTVAGTKRILYFHEDTILITVHATDKTDLKEIEEVVIARDFDELPEYIRKSISGKEQV